MSIHVLYNRLPSVRGPSCYQRSGSSTGAVNSRWKAGLQLLQVCLVTAFCLGGAGPAIFAAEPERDSGWLVQRDDVTGLMNYTRELTVHAAAEPRPALKHRLIADYQQRYDGNSALYYLKAMGFFEQTHAHKLKNEFEAESRQQAIENKTDVTGGPPWSWLNMAPGELPLEEVKRYLSFTSFQPPILAEAALQRRFSMDRHLYDIENPIGYLLPEIQSFRETARLQSMRFRVALAENRVDDAMAILGQQYAMANHLSQDNFLVSGLVGAAIAGIAWSDALYLSEHADAPNMYWAYAALPRPTINMPHAYAYERQMLYEQVKILREVDDQPRPLGYWSDFIDRLMPQLEGLGVEGLQIGHLAEAPELRRAQFVASLGAAYPGARRYLIEELGYEVPVVELMPVAQVVLLAMCGFYESQRDEHFKWQLVPYPQARVSQAYRQLDTSLREQAERLGWASLPGTALLVAPNGVRGAELRVELNSSLLGTIEALRDYASRHDGRLPNTLDDLDLPAPLNPFSGQPIGYEALGDKCVLSATANNLKYRIVVRMAK